MRQSSRSGCVDIIKKKKLLCDQNIHEIRFKIYQIFWSPLNKKILGISTFTLIVGLVIMAFIAPDYLEQQEKLEKEGTERELQLQQEIEDQKIKQDQETISIKYSKEYLDSLTQEEFDALETSDPSYFIHSMELMLDSTLKVCENVSDESDFNDWLLFLDSGVDDKVISIKEKINEPEKDGSWKGQYALDLKNTDQLVHSIDKCADSLDKYLK